jgi:hypothetical protein
MIAARVGMKDSILANLHRPDRQHPLHVEAACDCNANTATVPVATLSVRRPDAVPTTTVKASTNASLFMITPKDALSGDASPVSRQFCGTDAATGRRTGCPLTFSLSPVRPHIRTYGPALRAHHARPER